MRGSSLLLVGRLLSLVVNFVVQILIVRYLSKTAYGAFAYGLSIVSLGESVMNLGLDRTLPRFLPIYEERRDYDRMFGAIVLGIGTVLSLGLAVLILVWGLHGLLGDSLVNDSQAMAVLLILIVLSPIQALDGLMNGMFAVFSKPRAVFFRKYVLAPGLRLTAVLLLVLAGSGVRFLAVAYVAAGAVGVGIYTVILVRTLRQQGTLRHFDRRTMKVPAREIFAFALPVMTVDLVFVVMNTTDAVLLQHFRGAAEVASLRVIQPAAQMNQLVMTSFGLLFTPLAARLFARDDRKGIGDLYWQTAAWIAVLSFPIFALTSSLAHPFTEVLYGSRYEDSALLLQLLAIGYYASAATGFNGLTLRVFGRVWYVVVINLIAAIVNLALNLVLIPRYGALGAAIGTGSTLVAHNILKQVGLRLGTGVDAFDSRYTRLYVTIAVALLALLAVQAAFEPPFLAGFVLAAAVSLLILFANRSALRVGHTFPELMRFPLVKLLVRDRGR